MARESASYRITRELRCKLTPEEREARLQSLLKAGEEVDKLTAAFLETRREHRLAVTALHEEEVKLRGALRENAEAREIECQWDMDFELKRAVLTRTDTGEVLESRSLTPTELQQRLFPVPGEEDAAESNAPSTDAAAALAASHLGGAEEAAGENDPGPVPHEAPEGFEPAPAPRARRSRRGALSLVAAGE